MKKSILSLFCTLLFTILFTFPLLSQNLNWDNEKITYAVVVGISDYEDEERTDLKYAHRDAIIFADYLKSKAGGNVPEENIRLLTDEAATRASIFDGFSWLLQKTEKGNRVIIYFSGHGDVERESPFELGYLLAYDSPFNNYQFNAVDIEKLNYMATTLSVKREAEVIIITDACHSGKLAGNGGGGSQLVGENLAKQQANEVRITSCKPNEKSLEGQQWGGGRGIFSYHIINGLYGLADEEEDLQISLEDLEFYLKKKFREEKRNGTLDKEQTPQMIGNETFRLASVETEALENWKINLENEQMELAMNSGDGTWEEVAMRGEGENIGQKSTKQLEQFIMHFLDNQVEVGSFTVTFQEFQEEATHFFPENWAKENDLPLLLNFTVNQDATIQEEEKETIEDGLPAFLRELSEQANLPEFAKNQLAVACLNIVQNALNDYLKSSDEELKKRYFGQWRNYEHLPVLLETAASLLPNDHLSQPSIQIKLHYFKGLQTRFQKTEEITTEEIIAQAFTHQKQALALNENVPYVHNELGFLYAAKGDFKNAEIHYRKAIELAPTWVIPLSNLVAMLYQQGAIDEAKDAADKAIEMQPTFSGAYINRGFISEKENKYLLAEQDYQRAAQLNFYHYLPFERLGYLFMTIGDFDLANEHFIEAERRKKGIAPLTPNWMSLLSNSLLEMATINYDSLEKAYLSILEKDGKNSAAHFGLGEVYFATDKFSPAEFHYKKAIQNDMQHECAYFRLGDLFFKQNRLKEAEIVYRKAIEISPHVYQLYFNIAQIYDVWQRYESQEVAFKKIIEIAENKLKNDTNSSEKTGISCINSLEEIYGLPDEGAMENAQTNLWKLYEKNNRQLEAEKTILQCFERSYGWKDTLVYGFYNRRILEQPTLAYWHYQKAKHLYDYQSLNVRGNTDQLINGVGNKTDIISRENRNEAIHHFVEFIALEEKHPELFDIQFKIGDLYYKIDSLYEAADYLEKAVAGTPEKLDRTFYLVKTYLKNSQLTLALQWLDDLYENNQLDFENHFAYSKLLLRSPQFDKAENLLIKADTIQPQPFPEVAEELAKLYRLKGETEASIKWYKRALERDKENGNYYYGIARQLATQKQTKEALQMLEIAIDKGFALEWVLKRDADLDSLREESKFRKLLEQY